MKKIVKIRTGGQTGVDRAAMDFAREHEIPLCGWCPKNGWAEDYTVAPGLLKDYPELTETPSEGTEQRTKWNMRDCDAILTILPEGAYVSPGTDIGLQEGEVLGKPMCTVIGMNDVPAAISWIRTLPEETELCIGGPRASEWPEAYEVARCVLESLSKELCQMERKNSTKLYNILLPLWFIIFIPSWLWLLLIPANYLIDRIVLKWSLGDLEDKGLAITEDIGKALADVRALIEKQTVVA